MQNQENEKNGPVDYSKFFEEGREKAEIEQTSPDKEKMSFLSGLKLFWTGSDKKTKIQIIVFLVLVSLTIIILISYMVKSGIGVTQDSFYAPPAE